MWTKVPTRLKYTCGPKSEVTRIGDLQNLRKPPGFVADDLLQVLRVILWLVSGRKRPRPGSSRQDSLSTKTSAREPVDLLIELRSDQAMTQQNLQEPIRRPSAGFEGRCPAHFSSRSDPPIVDRSSLTRIGEVGHSGQTVGSQRRERARPPRSGWRRSYSLV
jgi:hypothetical protein